MTGEKILIVDDEKEINQLIALYLKEDRYQVITAENGYQAIKLSRLEKPDLIILDIFLPDIDGYQVCQKLRQFTTAPIIFLSSKSSETDKIVALMIGGDDYITKPFSPRELMARVNAHLRRNRQFISNNMNHIIRYDQLEINTESHMVSINGLPVQLSAKEFQLLKILAENPNRVFSLEQLFDQIWSEESLGDTRTIAVHISNLRKKIEKNPTKPKYIVTIRGVGYKFNRN